MTIYIIQEKRDYIKNLKGKRQSVEQLLEFNTL